MICKIIMFLLKIFVNSPKRKFSKTSLVCLINLKKDLVNWVKALLKRRLILMIRETKKIKKMIKKESKKMNNRMYMR
jgi:hypothetical protein